MFGLHSISTYNLYIHSLRIRTGNTPMEPRIRTGVSANDLRAASFQSGHSCVHRTDASAIERVCGAGDRVRVAALKRGKIVYTKIQYSACMNSFRIQRLDSFHAISHGIPIRPGSGPPRRPNRSGTARVGSTAVHGLICECTVHRHVHRYPGQGNIM